LDYKQACEYISSFEKNKVKLGLERINQLLKLCNIDLSTQKVVHIAGTNGKGSVSKYLEQILVCSNLKVGMFNSPYFLSQTDAIRVNNRDIAKDEFCQIVKKIKALIDLNELDICITRFEIVTAIALCYFVQQQCDIIILETGLGGTYDSTNVVPNTILEIITKISYDHMDYLGDSILSIAQNKAGIIKPKSSVVIAPQEFLIAFDVIKSVALQKDCKIFAVDNALIQSQYDGEFYTIYYKGVVAKIPLRGIHQLQNCATAIEAAMVLKTEGFEISIDNIVFGIQNTFWALRLQKVANSPDIFFDGAHNYDGMVALCNFVESQKKTGQYKNIFVLGILKDKEYKKMVHKVAKLSPMVVTTTPKNTRALDAIDLANEFKKYNICAKSNSDIKSAIQIALDLADKNDSIFIAGSLYFASEAYVEYKNIVNINTTKN